MDTEDDPEGKHDLIFETLRHDVDAAGGTSHTHSQFRALIAGADPLFLPPGTADVPEYGWGWTVGQTKETAGRVDYITVPLLVRGVTQISELAAGAGKAVNPHNIHDAVFKCLDS